MTRLEKRLACLEAQVRRDEADASHAFDPDPTAYRLIVWQWPDESEEQALARWGLTRTDIPAGVTIHLAGCLDQRPDPPWLAYHRHSPMPTKATKSEVGAYEQRLQEALHQAETMPRDVYDTYRAQQQAERWERAQQTLRQLAETQWCEGAVSDLRAERS